MVKSTSVSTETGAARPAARLYAARFLLAAAVAIVAAGWAIWNVPAFVAMLGVVAVILVAAFAPSAPVAVTSQPAKTRTPVWPSSAMKATLEAYPRPGFILDADGVVRFSNHRSGEAFPATRPGDPFKLTFRQPEMAEALRAAQGGGHGLADYQEAGSASVAYAASFSPIRPTGEGGGFVLVTFEDVSDRLAIARMRSDFVANASHELRTPLASLTGFIETLQGPARSDPQATDRFLAIMLDQAHRMRRLLDDLLSLSRAEMKAHRRPTDRVDLAAVINHVGDALAPLASEHGVAIVMDLKAGPWEVTGDRDELIQVFQNLFENAIRYGAAGQRVDVSAEGPTPTRPVLQVHVQDFGPGIAAEHLPRLTERFYRVDTGASRELKGTGLGLAIVKHILTRHQGRLQVHSEAGKGARFTVELPSPARDTRVEVQE